MRQTVGAFGEDIAEKHLLKNGYTIIERNYRLPRWGEIDFIAYRNTTLVFVEVRTKTSDSFGDPFESIIYRKRRSLKHSIEYYLLHASPLYRTMTMRIICIFIKLQREEHTWNLQEYELELP